MSRWIASVALPLRRGLWASPWLVTASLVNGCELGSRHFDVAIPTDFGGVVYVGNTSAIEAESKAAQALMDAGELGLSVLEEALEPLAGVEGAELVFSADGARFARVDGNGSIEIRDTGTGELQSSFPAPENPGLVAVSRDGSVVAVLAGAGLGTIHLVQSSDGAATDTGISHLGTFQFAGNSLFVVDNNLQLLRVDAGSAAPVVITTPAPLVSTIVAAPDSDRLFGLGRPDTNLSDDTLFVLDAAENSARAIELPAMNPRLLAVGKNGCLGFLSGKSLWLSGAEGSGFSTDDELFLDERISALSVAPDCKAVVFALPEDRLVGFLPQGETPYTVTAQFTPLRVVSRP